MKNKLDKGLLIFLAFVLALCLCGCGDIFGVGDDEPETTGGSAPSKKKVEISDDMTDEEMLEVVNNGIIYDEESEGAKLHFRKSAKEEYYGSWEITSGNAIYLYGNLELNILPGGRWTGTIVDEKMSGKWTFEKNKMDLRSEFFNASLAFTDDGKLIMQEGREDPDITDDEESGEGEDVINVVLTKVED
jgi:hypothetical protein